MAGMKVSNLGAVRRQAAAYVGFPGGAIDVAAGRLGSKSVDHMAR
jgi:hypothetical protein